MEQVLWVPGMVVLGGGGFDFAEVVSGGEVVLGGIVVVGVAVVGGACSGYGCVVVLLAVAVVFHVFPCHDWCSTNQLNYLLLVFHIIYPLKRQKQRTKRRRALRNRKSVYVFAKEYPVMLVSEQATMGITSYQNHAEQLLKDYVLADSFIPCTSIIGGIFASKVVSVGYFLADLGMILWFYPALGGFEYVIHHLLSIAAVAYAMLTGEGQLYTYMVLISETTTPGINLRWYLDATGKKRSRAYVINGVVIFFAWLLLFLGFIILPTKDTYKSPLSLALLPILVHGSAVAVLWVIFSICGAIGANCHELDVVRKDSQGIKEDNSQDAVKDTSITDILTANVIGRLKPLSSSASAFSPLYFPFSHV
ncbi:transmembrane protein 56-b [Quercus suber]|uniref:Transmembrane protein 56-b n=1 Tax=Quercus suber TaxID=58331 RepID=A0AAW0LU32_QUESU